MNKKLMAFDLDGTITQHKTIIEKENLECLQRLSEHVDLVIVGAGSCQRISSQLYDISTYIIGQYGLEVANLNENGDLFFSKKALAKTHPEDILNKIENLRILLGLESFKGDSAEFHSTGVITFPLLGTKAALEEKLFYDPCRSKRRKFLNLIKSTFPDYNVFIGGTSSFDLVPMPYNKHYALVEFAKEKRYKESNIIYFGDDFGEGGNDEPIFSSNIRSIEVNNFIKLPEIISKSLEN